MYYGYHQRIRQRIDAGELTGAYETDDYPRIGAALVLVFKTAPFLRPIRPHRWAEYRAMLDSMGIVPKARWLEAENLEHSERKEHEP